MTSFYAEFRPRSVAYRADFFMKKHAARARLSAAYFVAHRTDRQVTTEQIRRCELSAAPETGV